MKIHKTAVIDDSAKIANNVEIGPYSIIGSDVTIGKSVKICSHVVIEENTKIGDYCKIYPFACIGTESQDLKYKGEKTYVEIGSNTIIREYVTINRATGEGQKTVIGDNCFLMAYVHIAHNCIVGKSTIMANCATLAGHVELEEEVIIGGLSAVHQFCKIGKLALIGGCSKVVKDIPPFMIADGHPAVVRSVNSIGMKRKKYTAISREIIKKIYKILYRNSFSVPTSVAKIQASEFCDTQEAKTVLRFIESSDRGIAQR